jgi:Xaa-Pro aminopeptidase
MAATTTTEVDRTEIAADEYRARARRVATEATARGLEGVVVWSKGGGTVDRYADVLYLTNHYTQFPHIPDLPPYWAGRAHSACVVTREGETILISEIADWRRDIVVADRVVVDLDLTRGIAGVLAELGLDRTRVGLVAAETMVIGSWRLLQSRLPGVEWVPVDDILERMRAIKSEAEIGIIRESVRVGDTIMTAMLEACVAGATEADVAAAGYDAGIRRGAAPYDLPGASGPNSNFFSYGSLPSWAMRTLKPGDLYHSDMYGAYHGYYYDYTRSTVVGGDPSEDQLRVLEGAIGTVEAVIDALRPGVSFGEAYERGAAYMRDSGFEAGTPEDVVSGLGQAFPSFGHSLGLAWESPWIVPGNPAPIEENMYLAVEAAVGLPGVGAAGFEQDILIGPDGPEVLPALTPRWWER